MVDRNVEFGFLVVGTFGEIDGFEVVVVVETLEGSVDYFVTNVVVAVLVGIALVELCMCGFFRYGGFCW